MYVFLMDVFLKTKRNLGTTFCFCPISLELIPKSKGMHVVLCELGPFGFQVTVSVLNALGKKGYRI